jgi:MFS family permease
MTDTSHLIPRYYLYRTTNSAGFYLPVAVLFLQDEGFGLGFVGLAYAVYGFATLAAEVPTGYLGDLVGRRASLALGSALRVVVLGLYPFLGDLAGSVPLLDATVAYLLLHVLWAVGRSFRSGTQDAWLYEILGAHFDRDQFTRFESRGSTIVLVVSAVGAVAGAVLYTVDPALPFLTNAVLAGLGLPILFTFPAVPRGGTAPNDDGADGTGDDESEAPTDDTLGIGEAISVLKLQATRPAVRWLVAYAALFNALFLVTRIYEQPALSSVGVPVTGLGVLYAAFKLVSAGAAASAEPLERRLGVRGVFLAFVPVYGLAYAGLAVVPALVVPVLFVNRGLKTVSRPIRNQYLNDRLDDVGRATVLSGAAMALSLAGALARLAAGWGAARVGAIPMLAVAGPLVAVAGAVLWVTVSPVRNPDGSVPGESDTAGEAAVVTD